MILLIAVLFIFPSLLSASSHPVDLVDLVRQAIANYEQRRQRSENYTYIKHSRSRRLVRSGKYEWQSITMEIVFVHGGQDVRITEYNGKPIPREQQKSEWDRLQEIIDKHFDADTSFNLQAGSYYYEQELNLPLRQLTSMFNVKLKDCPAIDGRKICLVEARPKQGHLPADDEEKNAQAFNINLWIDEQDQEISKMEIKLLGEAKLFRPVRIVKVGGNQPQKIAGDSSQVYEAGTVLGMEWTKINGEAWLPKTAHLKGKFRLLPAHNIFPEEGEATYSGYRKFRVDTKVLPANN